VIKVAALIAPLPDTKTRPALISSDACPRERARFRRTSSASRRVESGGVRWPDDERPLSADTGLDLKGATKNLMSLLEDFEVVHHVERIEGIH
jgi:hypothetical protein